MIDVKASNPKDIIGSSKLPLELVPDTGIIFEALGNLEGALKYGRFNWRVAGVRSSIYRAAIGRHLMLWWNGEDCDPVTRVHHLASAKANLGILIDAMVCEKLEDDRPPAANVRAAIATATETVARLKDLFADHAPRQWTIADSEGTGDAWEPLSDLHPAEDTEGTGETPFQAIMAGLEDAVRYAAADTDPTDEAYAAATWKPEQGAILPIDVAYPPLVDRVFHGKTTTYSASPAAGVTLGPYSSQEALDKALYRWANYREILGETEDQREARLRREQDQ